MEMVDSAAMEMDLCYLGLLREPKLLIITTTQRFISVIDTAIAGATFTCHEYIPREDHNAIYKQRSCGTI